MNQDILKINIPGKNTIFHSPIENGNIFIRTGIQESENFLSAVLYASSPTYSQFNQNKQQDIAKKINKDILQKKKLIENDIALKILLKDEIINILSRFYGYIIDNKKDIDIYRLFIKDNDIEIFKIITELYIKKNLIKDVEQYFEKNNNFSNILDFLKNNFENILKGYPQIPLNKKNYCTSKLETIIKISINYIEENSLNNNLDSENILIDEQYIKNVMENVNRNIYIIEGKSKLPYKVLNEKFLKYNKSLILLKINNHYETVGIQNEENTILRDFNNNDEIILIINSYLYNRNYFNKNYNIKSDSDSDEYFKQRKMYLKTLDIGDSESEDN